MKLIKEAIWNCLSKSAPLPLLTVGYSWNFSWRFIGQMSMIWPLRSSIRRLACEELFLSREQKHLSVSAFAFRIALEKQPFLSPSFFQNHFQCLKLLLHHLRPPMAPTSHRCREERFNQSGILKTHLLGFGWEQALNPFFLFSLLFFSFLWFVYFFSLFIFAFFSCHEVFCYLNMCIFLWGIFAIYIHIQGILLPKHTYIYVLWGIFAIYMHIQGILLPKHTYIYFVKYFCYIHAYPRYLST